ncbi:MAG: hypothetical protein S4CHLAM102_14790 [Chlamydiia bacterium]|nr:hypothetical protein [Chlamydiia bacterium]
MNWKEVLSLSDDQVGDLRFIGYAYLRQGQYEVAKKLFKALVVLSDTNAYDHQTLGAIELQLGNNLEALDLLEKALHIDPDHAPTKLNRVKALFQLGYSRQATMQAGQLIHDPDGEIASEAEALLISYSR